MIEDNNNQNPNPQYDGERPSQTPPPPKDSTIRTMPSDVGSMKETGGGEPRPITPSTEEFNQASQPQVENKETTTPETGDISPNQENQQVKEEFVFEPPKIESQETQNNQQDPEPEQNLTEPKQEAHKIQQLQQAEGQPQGDSAPEVKVIENKRSPLIAWVVAFILVVAVGLGSYFFIFPAIFDTSPPPVAIDDFEEFEEEEVLPFLPIDEEDDFITEEEDLEEEEEVFEPMTRTISSFNFPRAIQSDLESDYNIDEMGAGALRQLIDFESTDVPIFKEVTLQYQGQFLSFAGLTDIMMPGVFSEETLVRFIPDAFLFIYSNDQGSWPGIIAQAQETEDLEELAQLVMDELEANTNSLDNLYLTGPGTPGSWADGQILNYLGRYLPFSQDGASLNVAWLDNYLVIGTNWPGATEAGRRMGFGE